jgi:release factor glutamine methyltransferase
MPASISLHSRNSRYSLPVVISRLRTAGCVFAEDEAELLLSSAGTEGALEIMLTSREAGIPLEHILGWVDFCGMRIGVAPDVFVPRQRTEFLLNQAGRVTLPGSVILDLCCGSGALGLVLARRIGSVELHAADIEAAAVRCARRNLETLGASVYEGDLFDPLPGGLMGRIDVLLANVPYVPTYAIGLMPAEARDHEPRVTLDGGDDGLEVLRRLADGVLPWLAPEGHVFIETDAGQAPAAVKILATAGLLARSVYSEEFCSTVIIGAKPDPGTQQQSSPAVS